MILTPAQHLYYLQLATGQLLDSFEVQLVNGRPPEAEDAGGGQTHADLRTKATLQKQAFFAIYGNPSLVDAGASVAELKAAAAQLQNVATELVTQIVALKLVVDALP